MRLSLMAGCAALLVACSAVEGPLLHERASPDGSAGGAGDGAPVALPFDQDVSWQYQLTGALDLELDVDLFVIDLFEPDPADIAQLHARDRIAVAYLSAGTRESFRDDAEDFPDAVVGNTHDRYPDEAWLDVRATEVRAVMSARLDQARDKGFDGIVPTSLSGYLQDTGFDLDAADQRDYSEWLTAQAHARGLIVAMTDDFEQVAQLAPHYDWAIHFGCIARGDCAELDPFRAQGKPLLDIEFEGEVADVCAAATVMDVNVLVKTPQFDAFRRGCP